MSHGIFFKSISRSLKYIFPYFELFPIETRGQHGHEIAICTQTRLFRSLPGSARFFAILFSVRSFAKSAIERFGILVSRFFAVFDDDFEAHTDFFIDSTTSARGELEFDVIPALSDVELEILGKCWNAESSWI